MQNAITLQIVSMKKKYMTKCKKSTTYQYILNIKYKTFCGRRRPQNKYDHEHDEALLNIK